MRRSVFRAALLLLDAATVVDLAGAQRPDSDSICDYYASLNYGANSSDTQFRLMQNIVALGFGGGGSSVPNATNLSTGILNPGKYNGRQVDLRSWFDGSKATTNLNNQAARTDWLDSGAQEPLVAFLNGSTDTINLDQTSNEYRLFTHFFAAFGHIFGCSLVGMFPKTQESGGSINLAYVHKFMDLNQTDLAHFIEQITLASRVFGLSPDDANALNSFMNSKYNVRCSPPDDNGMLDSLCLDPSCPTPVTGGADCDAYIDIGPNGANGTNSTSDPSLTSSPSPSSASTPGSGGGQSLSGGAIAGIVIASIVVVLLAIALFLYFRRRNNKTAAADVNATPQVQQMSPGAWSEGGYPSPMAPQSHLSYTPTLANTTHTSYGPHDSYLGPGGLYLSKHADAELADPSPLPPHSPPLAQMAEMESPIDYSLNREELEGNSGWVADGRQSHGGHPSGHPG